MPTDELDESLHCHGELGGAGLDPVLLVPGTGSTPEPEFGWNYAEAFAADGRPFCLVTLPENATGDIQVAAEHVVHALRTMREAAGRPVDMVGFSQGGMLPRWALRFWPDTRDAVDDFVGLAPSNHGTLDADAACVPTCAAAIWQQRTGSDFLAVLNAGRETFDEVDYTVAYTFTDEVVVPNAGPGASSPLRDGGENVTNLAVQQVCPGHAAEHLAMGSFDPVGYAIALDALDHDGPAVPDRVDRAACLEPFMPGVDPVTFPADFAAFSGEISVAVATAPRLAREPTLRDYATGRA